MQVNSLFQSLVNQIINEINSFSPREINLGDLLTAQVKAFNDDMVLLRVQGQDIYAKTLVPMEVGEDITFQYQGLQDGKAIFKLVSDAMPDRAGAYINKIIKSLQLPNNDTNLEIVKQLLLTQQPLERKDIYQLHTLIKNLALPIEDIGTAVYIFQQGLPLNKENIHLVQEFLHDNLQLFKGIEDIKTFLDSQPTLPGNLKTAITSLLKMLNEIKITPQNHPEEISSKLANTFHWQAESEDGPELLLKYTMFTAETNIETVNQSNSTISITNQSESTIPTANQSESTISTAASNVAEVPEQIIPSLPSLAVNTDKPSAQININPPSIVDAASVIDDTLPIKELIQDKIGLLAGKTISDHDKLNLFLHNLKETISTKSFEINQLINNISRALDSSNPKEHAIKEVLKDFAGKINFLEHFIPAAPIDNNQQIIFWGQTLLNDGSQNNNPINIMIKRPRGEKGKKISFDNCTISVSLQTINLGLIKATIQKAERNLACGLQVINQETKAILEPALPQLATSLENLNFRVSLMPIKVVDNQRMPKSGANDTPINLFNVDIRV